MAASFRSHTALVSLLHGKSKDTFVSLALAIFCFLDGKVELALRAYLEILKYKYN